MNELYFDKNYNNKLNCTYFVDVRQYRPEIHIIGLHIKVRLLGEVIGTAKLVSCRRDKIHNLTPFVAFHAFGMTACKARDCIRNNDPPVYLIDKDIAISIYKMTLDGDSTLGLAYDLSE